jgi:hypothetical protein
LVLVPAARKAVFISESPHPDNAGKNPIATAGSCAASVIEKAWTSNDYSIYSRIVASASSGVGVSS